MRLTFRVLDGRRLARSSIAFQCVASRDLAPVEAEGEVCPAATLRSINETLFGLPRVITGAAVSVMNSGFSSIRILARTTYRLSASILPGS
jgi:hypothetical protein